MKTENRASLRKICQMASGYIASNSSLDLDMAALLLSQLAQTIRDEKMPSPDELNALECVAAQLMGESHKIKILFQASGENKG